MTQGLILGVPPFYDAFDLAEQLTVTALGDDLGYVWSERFPSQPRFIVANDSYAREQRLLQTLLHLPALWS